MRAADITQKVVAEMDRDFYDVFIVNYANGDMLAHLGILDAAVQGVQTVDASLATLKQKVLEKGGTLIITADHGNVESMIYQTTGDRETRHDSNPVPLYLVGAPFARPRSDADIAQSYAQVNGIIADVAPTILELLEIQKPVEMTGSSLLPILNH
jgi:2,3-bisphosphoglycerate-independent phosphoglycerate mutase